ncbi:hydroxymethylbilane synthase [Gracilimonas mengyeensis]|uniref:Hydroxymethylbilane synthase n=1 Tax=Gracilimonas mengyeensis TaxID=1302730 RepID=A0A521BGY5_9BACT|nr:hydroxymethylbilane synthase [Gracilimonas mengyeensis]SMO46378.1 hydroxymethylbilane synthase [Gracilimonas mengyeensis]
MKLRIGTRKSTLALWQANKVADALHQQGIDSELVEIESFGDKVQDIPLNKLGDKGVFTKALDDALLAGEIDLAVHSLKDVPTVLPEGLKLTAVLERGNPADALVRPAQPKKMDTRVIATGSIRRTAFWKNRFPEDEVVGLRGNVPTRLDKVDSNEWYGGIFAAAGLERIGYEDRISEVLHWMIPAPSQGIVGIVTADEIEFENELAKIDHKESHICGAIERAFLNELEAGCSSPVGAHAYIKNEMLYFVGAVLSLDGSRRLDVEQEILLGEASADKGTTWAKMLKSEGAEEILEQAENG